MCGERERAIDPERRAIGNADHGDFAGTFQPCHAVERPVRTARYRVAGREQRGEDLIERHDRLPAVVARQGRHLR